MSQISVTLTPDTGLSVGVVRPDAPIIVTFTPFLGLGGEGGGDKNFIYTQASASAVWMIAHNLSKFPSVTVVDSAGSVVEGDVEYPDVNTVTLTFSSPFGGTAYLN